MSLPPNNAQALPTVPLGATAFEPIDHTALWWLGSAGFLLNVRGTLVAIDPAISLEPGSTDRSEVGFRLRVPHPIDAADVPRLDLVLYTHTDIDHLAPITARELMRTDATFAGPKPVVEQLRAFGLSDNRLRSLLPGDGFAVAAVEVAATRAEHAWQVQDPARYGPPFGPDDCCGYLVRTPDGTIWCTGDTVLLDEHLATPGVDVLLLDISRDRFHLGPANAALLANRLGAPHLIPHHYGCYDAPDFPPVNGDPAEVAALIADAAHRLHVLGPGERFVLPR